MVAREPLSVAELAHRLKQVVGQTLSHDEWVEGELVQVKRAPSGHTYFSLKDVQGKAVISAVMYQFDAQRAWRVLQEGARVLARGKPDYWGPGGRLQLVVKELQAAGRGAQLEALERLKRRLAEEGLFDAARKRPLPSFPRVVGLITSEAGAALHDVISVTRRRGGAHLVLAPAVVQGEQAVRSLLRAIDAIVRHPEMDVLIVGRGGGSSEDLMAFNDERLVRRLAAVPVPVVSAVGHEIDITLTDLVADVRAATPSQAAELVVAERVNRERELLQLERRLGRAIRARLDDDHQVIERTEARLGDPEALLGAATQRLDDLTERLEEALRRRVDEGHIDLNRLEQRLLRCDPARVIERALARLAALEPRLHAWPGRALTDAKRELTRAERALTRGVQMSLERRWRRHQAHATRLEDLSPLRVLSRGYAIASLRGRVLREASAAQVGDELTLKVSQGSLTTRVTAVYSASSPPTQGEDP
ncbi:MAG: exodeoxyribonuclease VII large subunit [Polyangiaceae bacterium]|nr:exodeoxyribonuclease VII large subunit [Polyangiaceae bacterium]MCW5792656.1 exodeoxyribonuclease VII large subunit [Polyangiaceae bacterium]